MKTAVTHSQCSILIHALRKIFPDSLPDMFTPPTAFKLFFQGVSNVKKGGGGGQRDTNREKQRKRKKTKLYLNWEDEVVNTLFNTHLPGPIHSVMVTFECETTTGCESWVCCNTPEPPQGGAAARQLHPHRGSRLHNRLCGCFLLSGAYRMN